MLSASCTSDGPNSKPRGHHESEGGGRGPVLITSWDRASTVGIATFRGLSSRAVRGSRRREEQESLRAYALPNETPAANAFDVDDMRMSSSSSWHRRTVARAVRA